MRNPRIKTACATGAFTLAMAMPVYAAGDNQVTRQMISEADRIAIFGRDSNVQVALLTEDEMAETKGAAWWSILFRNVWYVRLGWGGLYGYIVYGYEMSANPNSQSYRGSPKLMGDFIVTHAMLGMMSSNPALATLAGVGSVISVGHGGTLASLEKLQYLMRNNNWTIPIMLERLNRGIERTVQDNLQGSSRSSASAYASSGSDSSFLVRITNSLDRTSLRNFLSSIPEKTLNPLLAQVTPGGTREDFLSNLPAEAVSGVILRLPEVLMQRFTTDVLSEPMRTMLSGISTGATVPQTETMRVHWLH